MKEINQIAFCAMMSSLSVAIMFVGSIFCYSTLLVAAGGGFVAAIVARETSFSNSIIFYFVVVVLTNLFVPRKGILIDYLLFVGIYPILEFKICKIKNSIIRFGFKIIIFTISAILMLGLGLLISGINDIKLKNFSIFGVINIPIENVKLIGLCVLIIWCFCYDFFLQEFKSFYEKQLKSRIFKHCFKF